MIIGGIRSIARVAAVLVPIMGLIYVFAALVVIGLSAEHIPGALALVMNDAFTGQTASGGILGAMVIGFACLVLKRSRDWLASIANRCEDRGAGIEAYRTAEPLIDTVIICSLSSLVILTTAIPQGLMGSELVGIELTSLPSPGTQLGALRDCDSGVAVRVFKRAGTGRTTV